MADHAVNICKISELISNVTCFEMIRENRWPDGVVHCPHCDSGHVKKNGHDTVQTECQHYQCKHCDRYFDDLTNTVFAGHHQPLKVWVSCLYLMGLNVSNSQISKELDLSLSDVHEMTTLLRTTVVKRKPDITLEGEVEFDEVYIVAGHKGHPEALKKSIAPSPKKKIKRSSGQRNSRKRQASRSGNDSARRSGHYQHAG
ncbi:transposase [Endozoicomonas montiporae]|nr:transposase [Endozoicomonas montiporae]